MTDASAMPYWQTAQTYFDAGWSPVPLPYKEKSPVPDNVTGSTAPYVSAEQVARWCGRKRLGVTFKGRPEMAKAGNLTFQPGNIALRMPQDVIGIDVDLYDGKAGAETLADAVSRWGDLPPTWMSTSRRDGSGIRYFQVPPGLKWRDVGPGVETIKWYHRYAIVMPSVHDKTGKTYIWITPDGQRVTDEFPSVSELPMLPAAWVAGLTEGQEYTGSGDAGDIDYDSALEWLETHGSGDMCTAMHDTLMKYARAVREAGDDGGAHDRARDGAWAILGDAAIGHCGAEEAIRQLGSVFFVAVAGRRSGAAAEWRRIVIKGVGKVRTELKKSDGAPSGGDPCEMFSDSPAAIPAQRKGSSSSGSGAFDFVMDDIGNAQRLAAAVGTDARWVPALGSWAVYEPSTSLWRVESGNDAMVRAAIEVVRSMKKEASFIEDPEMLKAFRAHVKSSGGSERLSAMLKLARSLRGIAIDANSFDACDDVLQVANGAVVLGDSGASFRSRVHGDFATFCAPVPYVAGTRSKVWEKFLADVLPDAGDRRWTQTLLGYSLTGGNPERAFIIAKGLTTSGKSTMVRAVAAALGAYAGPFNQHLFREKKDEGPRVDILTVMPKRFLYCVEGSTEIPWHADVIKRATGNDTLSARGMHSNIYVERVPAFTPWLATNINPSIPNSDKALARRIYAAPFNAVILEADTQMIKKLTEPSVLAAVMAWLIEGWDIYASEGLRSPSPAAVEARQAAIDSLSLFNEFLAECCEEGPESEGYLVTSEDIRTRWIGWLVANGHEDSRMHTAQWVGRRLSDHGLERVRRAVPGSGGDQKVWYRLGVRLKATGLRTGG